MDPISEFQFNFCVTGLSAGQNDALFEAIIKLVEDDGGEIGGGYHELEANDGESAERSGVQNG